MDVTAKRLIEWLQTQPEDAIIEVASVTGHGYDGPLVSMVTLQEKDLGDYGDEVSVVDMRGNPHVKPDAPYYNKVFIQFGNT